jgi:hypothetical protein
MEEDKLVRLAKWEGLEEAIAKLEEMKEQIEEEDLGYVGYRLGRDYDDCERNLEYDEFCERREEVIKLQEEWHAWKEHNGTFDGFPKAEECLRLERLIRIGRQ